MTLAGGGARGSSAHCPMCKSARGYATPLYAVRSNEIGDDLYECTACGYRAVYRVQTREFEPPKEQLSEAWQPPLLWPLPLRFDPDWPNARKRPRASARPLLPETDSGEQHDHVQPAAADPAQQLRKATSEEPAGGSEHGQSNEGPGEPLPPENPASRETTIRSSRRRMQGRRGGHWSRTNPVHPAGEFGDIRIVCAQGRQASTPVVGQIAPRVETRTPATPLASGRATGKTSRRPPRTCSSTNEYPSK